MAKPQPVARALSLVLLANSQETTAKKGVNEMRKGLAFLAAIGMTVAVTSTALANSVHLKGGAGAEPTFTDNGLTLNASGDLAGLGFGDVLVSISAVANPTATCTNNGGSQAPGQNPAPVTVTGSESIPASELKNGNTPFSVTTNAPATPILGAPDCPNPNWTEDITDMAFTSATITVEQPAGTLVLTVACTFSSATTNGTVPAGNVDCTSS